jgi:hypothetical protein
MKGRKKRINTEQKKWIKGENPGIRKKKSQDP